MRIRDTDKQQLVRQKAVELIVKDGLEGFSMNKLAKACKISVATLYIYYKDRDDLITSIAVEEGKLMGQLMLNGLDPEDSFENGLRVQWKNRYGYLMANPLLGSFFEQLQSSTYHSDFIHSFAEFKTVVSKFMHNVTTRGEMDEMPFETYWSIAFSPLYTLIRFHNQGQSIGGKRFTLTEDVLWKTFDLVVKALKK